MANVRCREEEEEDAEIPGEAFEAGGGRENEAASTSWHDDEQRARARDSFYRCAAYTVGPSFA